VYGLQVSTAARIMELACGGQVLCSRAVFDDARAILRGSDLAGLGPVAWCNHGPYRFKGVEDPYDVCEVTEAGPEGFKRPIGSEKARPADQSEEETGWRPGPDAVLPERDWVMEQKLGEGGFGEVWLARHSKDERRKAVFKFCTRRNRLRSLRRELEAFKRLSDREGRCPPGIVEVRDTHDTAPPYYIELEYVSGGDLRQWLEREGETAPLRMKLDVALQMVRAVGRVHEVGLVHRDIKPSNFLVEQGDDPNRAPTLKLTDFGIGQVALNALLGAEGTASQGEAASRGDLSYHTQTLAQAAGSLGFIAPELQRMGAATPGQVEKRAGTAADVYSLGVTLYQLFVGDPTGLPGVRMPGLDDPILREDIEACIGDKPEQRPHVKDLTERLGRHDERLEALRAEERARIRREKRRAHRILAAVSVSLAIALAAGGIAWYQWRRVRVEQARTEEQRRLAVRTLVRSDFLIGIEYAERGDPRVALAHLARALRNDQSNCPAATRILSLVSAGMEVPVTDPIRHEGAVNSAVFSPDGKRIVTASGDSTARVWDAQTGRPLCEPMKHEAGVASAAFSPDGSRIVTLSVWTARVWDAQTGKPLAGPMKHEGWVTSAVFSPDSKRIVTTSHDDTARVWDAQTGKRLAEVMKHWNSVLSAAFSPDAKRILTTSVDDTTRVWDAETGAPLAAPMKHRGRVESAVFSPDGIRIITVSNRTACCLWDGGSEKSSAEPMQHKAEVVSAVFSPDGSRIVTTSRDNAARVWDTQTGRPVTEPLRHADLVKSAAFSPDGRRIVTTSHDNSARVWDAETGRPLAWPMRHDGLVNSAVFSPDGTRIVTASDDKTARVWDAQTGRPVAEPLRHGDWVNSAVFSPDGSRVATASDDKTARVWDAQTCRPVADPLRHGNSVKSAAFSADGGRILTASYDGTARVWDAQTGRPLAQPMKHEGWVNSAVFSLDGKRVVTASNDATARVWDARTGRPVSDPMKHENWVNSAVFSPDGRRVVTASGDETARVWDAQTGRPVTEPLRHGHWVKSAAFSPDGGRIVTASHGKTCRVWDAQTGKPLADFIEHDGGVSSAVFSPDGKRIVTASDDSTARVWDAQTGRPAVDPLRHARPVILAVFSPDGKRIATGSYDTTARVWDAETGRSLAEPMRYRDSVYSAVFSPDGKRLVVAITMRGEAAVWDIGPGADVPIPTWLPALAEAVGGRRLDENGVLASVPADALSKLREQLASSKEDDAYTVFARWLFADRATRTISPYSKLTVPEYIENRIAEGTEESLHEAELLAVGNKKLLARIRAKLANLRNRPSAPPETK
ncbi:MAG: hypothetical protein FJ290_19130, partial [Planctomycetes bacterium]|nr:hypothetical protein [Planctomycetota bacterium]